MPTETAAKPLVYQGMLHLEKPLYVWTPDGGYEMPRWIAVEKSSASRTLFQTMQEMQAACPKQRPLTSGEWSVAREHVQAAHPEIEKGMITGLYEKTATILDYIHGSRGQSGDWFDGLIIQIPESNGKEPVTDEKGIIKARDVWHAALPLKPDYAKSLPSDCDTFLNIIHGAEGARKKLPGYAYVNVFPEGGLNNLVRGRWLYGGRGRRRGRVDVDGHWRPSLSDEGVASRGAAIGRLVCNWSEEQYASLKSILEKTRDSTPEGVIAAIEQARSQLAGALAWEDI